MMQINLTTRKKSLPEKVLGTFFKDFDQQNNVVYKARYSSEYKDEGHDFNKSFKVLRSAYWLKYDIISHLDVSLYETLQFLCEAEIPFSLQILAEKMRIGDATLRKCLDNLENAELLEIVKSDGQGQPNYYIIRTPFFEKENFKETNKAKVLRKYGELPETFLETEIDRLRRQIRKNSARKLRNLARKQNLSNRKKDIQKIVKTNKENRLRVWHRIIKTFGNQDAVNFDAIVWRLCHNKDLLQIHGRDFDAAFKRFLKFEFEKARMTWNEFYLDLAQELRAFYDARIRLDRTAITTSDFDFKPRPPASNGDNKKFQDPFKDSYDYHNRQGEYKDLPDDDYYEILEENEFLSPDESLRMLLETRKKGGYLTNEPVSIKTMILRNKFNKSLAFEQIVKILSEFYDNLTMQKITVELRR